MRYVAAQAGKERSERDCGSRDQELHLYDFAIISVLVCGGLASIAWVTILGGLVLRLAGVRLMWMDSSVALLSEAWSSTIANWPSAALTLAIFGLGLVVHKRMQRIETQLAEVRELVNVLRQREERRMLIELKSADLQPVGAANGKASDAANENAMMGAANGKAIASLAPSD